MKALLAILLAAVSLSAYAAPLPSDQGLSTAGTHTSAPSDEDKDKDKDKKDG
jgi:hypothetical protein